MAPAALVERVRPALDVEREPQRAIHLRALLHWRNLTSGVAVLRSDRSLTSLTALAVSFAVVQGCLFSFTVTYLAQRGFSLAAAGAAYAAMQAAGVFARILLGWFADRTGRPAVEPHRPGLCRRRGGGAVRPAAGRRRLRSGRARRPAPAASSARAGTAS